MLSEAQVVAVEKIQVARSRGKKGLLGSIPYVPYAEAGMDDKVNEFLQYVLLLIGVDDVYGRWRNAFGALDIYAIDS